MTIGGRLGALVFSALLAACTSTPQSGSPTEAPGVTASPSSTASARTPSAVAWRGLYYRLDDPSKPMGLGGRMQLVLAEGQLPGRAIRPELTWWGATVPEWSPDGTRAVLRDRDSKTYIVANTGVATELTSAWGDWRWLTNDELVSVHDEPGRTIAESRRLLARMDARTGRIISERAVSRGVQPGLVSPDARWIAFTESGPHGPNPGHLYEIATDRLLPLGTAGPIGWLPDGRLVLGYEGGVDVIRPDTLAREQVLGAHGQVLAQPHTPQIVIVAPDGTIWTVVPGSAPVRTPVPGPFRGTMHAISANGAWVSFTEQIEATYPAVPSERVGVVNLQTGAITYGCDRECRSLAVR